MERLTRRTNGVVVYVGAHNEEAGGQIPCEVGRQGVCEILARLAEYEDTGLTPEDCEEYKKFEDEIIASGKTFGRLIELLKADKEDRVVALPCKVGDTVYVSYGEGYSPCIVDRIHVLASNEFQIRVRYLVTEVLLISASEFGKAVFLNREEAEKALRRDENG